MIHSLRRTRVILAAATLILGTAVMTAHAQENPRVDETIRTSVGEIVEIVAVQADPSARHAWILERDGSFVQAARDADFQARLTEPGTYVLSATVSSADGTPAAQRAFALEVRPRDALGSGTSDTSGSGDLVITFPPAKDGIVVFAAGWQLLTLTPNRADVSAYRVDLDPAHDSDGDGNATNDDDLPRAYITKNHVPLSLWFTAPPAEQSISITGLLADGSSRTQILRIRASGAQASASSMMSVPAYGQDDLLSIAQGPEGALQFSIPQIVSLNVPVLTYWSFGDGTESLITSPSHRYQQSGTYEVRVRVVDLRTGMTMFEASRNATVQAYIPSSSASSSQQSSAEASSQGGSTPARGGISLAALLPIARILVVLIGIILLIAAVIWVVGKLLRRGGPGRFQKTLETIDARFAPPGGGTVEEAQPLTISPQPETSPEAPIKEEEPPVVAAFTPPPAEPTVDLENAPSWLKNSVETAPPAQEIPSPPSPAVEAAPLAPVAQTTPPVTPPPTEHIDVDNAPPWLRTGLGTQTPAQQETSAPAETPVGVPTEPRVPATQEPAIEPLPAPAQESVQSTGIAEAAPPPPPSPAENIDVTNAPPWLRTGLGAEVPAQPEPPASAEAQQLPRAPTLPVATEPIATPVLSFPAEPAAAPMPPPTEPGPPPAPPQSTSAPSSAPTQPASTQAPATAEQKTPTAEDAERDRERKRLKRKRYRENLKRRRLGEKNDGTPPATPTPPQPVGTQATVPQEEKATPPPLTIPVPAPPQPQSKESETASQEATAAVTPLAEPPAAVPPGDAPIAATPSVDVAPDATPPTSATVPTDPLSTLTPETPSTTAASVSPPEPTRSSPTPRATPKDDDVLFMVRADDVQDEAQPGIAK